MRVEGSCVSNRLLMQDTLEFKKKLRVIKVRMLDGSVKSIAIDDSHIVEQLMVTICLKIGKLFIYSWLSFPSSEFLMRSVFDCGVFVHVNN